MKEERTCEFCSKKRKTASTMIFSNYCLECLRIVIEQCKEAIKGIKENK